VVRERERVVRERGGGGEWRERGVGVRVRVGVGVCVSTTRSTKRASLTNDERGGGGEGGVMRGEYVLSTRVVPVAQGDLPHCGNGLWGDDCDRGGLSLWSKGRGEREATAVTDCGGHGDEG
jgi:hypothetical protein